MSISQQQILSFESIDHILNYIHTDLKHIIFKGNRKYYEGTYHLILIFFAGMEEHFKQLLKSDKFKDHVGYIACKYNFPQTLDFCINNDLMNHDMLSISTIKGNLSFIKTICNTTVDGNPNWWKNPSSSAYAAGKNHVDCLKLLHLLGNPWDKETTSFAGQNGSFDCLKYSIDNGCETDRFLMKTTAISGSIRCLQFCLDNKIEMTVGVMGEAGRYGEKQCLKLLLKYKCPWKPEEFYEMIENGHEQCLKLIITKLPLLQRTTFAIKQDFLISATLKSNHTCLTLLLDKGFIPDKLVSLYAVTFGHLEYLKLLQDRNAPIHECVLVEAIREGRYECVKWLHEHHFTCNANWESSFFAAASRNLPTLQYVKDNNIGVFSKQHCLKGYHYADDQYSDDPSINCKFTTFWWNDRFLEFERCNTSSDMLQWINNL